MLFEGIVRVLYINRCIFDFFLEFQNEDRSYLLDTKIHQVPTFIRGWLV
jgi:hypothetical protein